jgi:hypothetical protein
LETREECCQSSKVVTTPGLSKITKAKRMEEMVFIHMWLSSIKALPDENSIFFRQGLLLK